jgi:hypothetical protein
MLGPRGANATRAILVCAADLQAGWPTLRAPCPGRNRLSQYHTNWTLNPGVRKAAGGAGVNELVLQGHICDKRRSVEAHCTRLTMVHLLVASQQAVKCNFKM